MPRGSYTGYRDPNEPRVYIHALPEWPRFRWSAARLSGPLANIRLRQGRLLGRMEGLGFTLRQDAILSTLTEDVVKTSEIEGERLDIRQVRSSIARRLGVEVAGLIPADRHVEGVVEMTLDATRQFHLPLTAERLFGWHSALFPTGRSGLRRIQTGRWRDDREGPMRIISGPMGREKIHFEAPPAARLPVEMTRFMNWLNREESVDGVLRAGLAHLWFVTVHPFDDGNGRIARAIADMLLARSEGSSQRFYSMSAQIRHERSAYYDILQSTQQGTTTDITPWMEWFLGCLGRAIDNADSVSGGVMAKARFWDSLRETQLNDRQRLVLNRLLDGLEGKLTTSKYATFAKCSQDTAARDIQPLIDLGVLLRSGAGGRSTSYDLRPL